MSDSDLHPAILERPIRERIFTLETLLAFIAIMAGVVLVFQLFVEEYSVFAVCLSGATIALAAIALLRLLMDPDYIRARQTDSMLRLARQMVACLHEGLDSRSAQKICQLLLPNTTAAAVAITNHTTIMGYAGVTEQPEDPVDMPIFTQSTFETLNDGKMRVLLTPADIGFPFEPRYIKAAIVMPLRRGRTVAGTLKFYYRSSRNITETQKSIAEGFASMLSTQLAAEALEEKSRLATSMELKALQAQINPHFLFNTINTIASLTRTDPAKARILLRDFASFYRHTLDNASDLIELKTELAQVTRYLSFEQARFGEERIGLELDIPEDLEDMLMPSFLIQPLVENSVHHGRPAEGKLTIRVSAKREGDFMTVCVEDDGVGMDEEAVQRILSPESSTGLGIAVRNVNDRLSGYFGPGSHLEAESELGVGTKISLVMNVESEQLRRKIVSLK